MSSLLDVPVELIMAFSLAVSPASGSASRAELLVKPEKIAVFKTESLKVDGPLAFSEERWLEALQSGAGGPALAGEARRIFKTSSGRFYIPEAGERERIAALRRTADVATRVAEAYAKNNAAILKQLTGSTPTPGALYLAHLTGATAAADFINRTARSPETPASSFLPAIDLQAQRLLALGGKRQLSARKLLGMLEAATVPPAVMKPTVMQSAAEARFQFAPRQFALESGSNPAQ